MLTGDNENIASYIADKLKIDAFEAGLLPEEKLEKIEEYQENGEQVAMVGDGINDAPSLATADIGIAMEGAGTDAAIAAKKLTKHYT